jgi:hypothetical protein
MPCVNSGSYELSVAGGGKQASDDLVVSDGALNVDVGDGSLLGAACELLGALRLMVGAVGDSTPRDGPVKPQTHAAAVEARVPSPGWPGFLAACARAAAGHARG